MSQYTSSGARRIGDEYQDLQSAEILIEWLEDPSAYRWVRLEAMDGSLDDIQLERADGTHRLLQVKWGTRPQTEWDWPDLTYREPGSRKRSLIQKWYQSFQDARTRGLNVAEAGLLTNRNGSAAIIASLNSSGAVDLALVPTPTQATLASQLGTGASVSEFFNSFRFHFRQRSVDSLEKSLRERFTRLGGTDEGWHNLLRCIRSWINYQDMPSPDGKIRLQDLRLAALWLVPPLINEHFPIPPDYVPPDDWSVSVVEPRINDPSTPLTVISGTPGIGKSTYLSWLTNKLESADVPVVRHHYFLSTTDSTLTRSAWHTVATSLIGQLLRTYPGLVNDAEQLNPTPLALRAFLTSAGRKRVNLSPLVVIIDGLDHVWRESGVQTELHNLFEHILPAPEGISILVGTQDIDISMIPLRLRQTSPREAWLYVPELNAVQVRAWLTTRVNDLFDPPSDNAATGRLLDDLATAFWSTTGGHPLIMHYLLILATHRRPVTSDLVRSLHQGPPVGSVAAYYQILWDSIDARGHQLLHLLAGFPWAWPSDGLLACLTPSRNIPSVEDAQRSTLHVLGTSPLGLSAFHESLLAFIRAQPGHADAVEALRCSVVHWLTHDAPSFWRWRYQWDQEALLGDASALIEGPSLGWVVQSLVDGRDRHEIANVIGLSGWAALRAGRLGAATERGLLDAYVAATRDADDVIAHLLWIALQRPDAGDLDENLALFIARQSTASAAEIAVVARISHIFSRPSISSELFNECANRWNFTLAQSDRRPDAFDSLEIIAPSVIAATLQPGLLSPYQLHRSKYSNDPAWCPRDRYAQVLGLYCTLGGDTAACRSELRGLANDSDSPSIDAVDEIVRIAWRDDFDPRQSLPSPAALKSGLFQLSLFFLHGVTSSTEPESVSFEAVWSRHYPSDRDEELFLRLARRYFFACTAFHLQSLDPPMALGVDAQASKTTEFLNTLRAVGHDLAEALTSSQFNGAAWWVHRLHQMSRPFLKVNDFADSLLRHRPLGRLFIDIAQDLEDLYYAKSRLTSLCTEVVYSANRDEWTSNDLWIQERVDRDLALRNSELASRLISDEKHRLRTSRDYLPTRAFQYAMLARFAFRHQRPADEWMSFSQLAARNIVGHGIHKDLTISDLLDALKSAPGLRDAVKQAAVQSIAPVVRIIDEITDHDETRYFHRDLGLTIKQVIPSLFASYVQRLQDDRHFWSAEEIFTKVAESWSLISDVDRALVGTLIHEDALEALERRAVGGDADAETILSAELRRTGRTRPLISASSQSAGILPTPSLPPIDSFPPDRFAEFVRAIRDAGVYSDDHVATWADHWSKRDPDGFLRSLETFRDERGCLGNLSVITTILRVVSERQGDSAAWCWLVAYHQAVSGWSSSFDRLDKAEWVWGQLRRRYPSRWLEFIVESSTSRWRGPGSPPRWSIERLVRFLATFDEASHIEAVICASVDWCAGLAADIVLPPERLEPLPASSDGALHLLLDRLDCPSRMVQERAAWFVALLLARSAWRDDVLRELFRWHDAKPGIELRSCVLLTITRLAEVAHGAVNLFPIVAARTSNLVPSAGAAVMLRDFSGGHEIVTAEWYIKEHSETAPTDYELSGFNQLVRGHLANAFLSWATALDALEIPFQRQWQHEAAELASRAGFDLGGAVRGLDYYGNGADNKITPINDTASMILRSAYLRALHWALDHTDLESIPFERNTRRAAFLADVMQWMVQPSARPDWWPIQATLTDTDVQTVGVDRIQDHLLTFNGDGADVLLFASGPVHQSADFCAELEIRAFFQSAHGSGKPTPDELGNISQVRCIPWPPRSSILGSYVPVDDHGFDVGNWFLAPLAWWLQTDGYNWLSLDWAARGTYVPAGWLFAEAPTISTHVDAIRVGSEQGSRCDYRYWYDDYSERQYLGGVSRAGCELVAPRALLAPHIAAGATLCWVASLWGRNRTRHERGFAEAELLGTWVFADSTIVRPNPWGLGPDGA